MRGLTPGAATNVSQPHLGARLIRPESILAVFHAGNRNAPCLGVVRLRSTGLRGRVREGRFRLRSRASTVALTRCGLGCRWVRPRRLTRLLHVLRSDVLTGTRVGVLARPITGVALLLRTVLAERGFPVHARRALLRRSCRRRSVVCRRRVVRLARRQVVGRGRKRDVSAPIHNHQLRAVGQGVNGRRTVSANASILRHDCLAVFHTGVVRVGRGLSLLHTGRHQRTLRLSVERLTFSAQAITNNQRRLVDALVKELLGDKVEVAVIMPERLDQLLTLLVRGTLEAVRNESVLLVRVEILDELVVAGLTRRRLGRRR